MNDLGLSVSITPTTGLYQMVIFDIWTILLLIDFPTSSAGQKHRRVYQWVNFFLSNKVKGKYNVNCTLAADGIGSVNREFHNSRALSWPTAVTLDYLRGNIAYI